MILVLDIETIPDPTWTPPPDARDPFAPAWAHEVVSLGCMSLDDNLENPRLGVLAPNSEPRERSILDRFRGYLEQRGRVQFVTWNGRGFDLPVLAMRSFRHAVAAPWYFDDTARKRYAEAGHLDLADQLTANGAARMMKLSDVARSMGLPGKMGTDGGDVAAMHAAGELAAIDAYCLSDVAQTALVLLRYQMLAGRLELGAYRDRVRGILAAIDADVRIAELAAAVDRDRVLAITEAERLASLPADLAYWPDPDTSSE